MNAWDADVDLSPAGAARLVEEQFPELAPVRLEVLGAGWDNLALLVNGEWVFRFPRRAVAARLIERECAVLPLLAPHLPLPVPVPHRIGAPGDGYRYPFAGYRILPGITACRAGLSDEERAALVPALAGFLQTLHSLPPGTAPPVSDELERADHRRRASALREKLAHAARLLPDLSLAALRAEVDRLAAAPAWQGPGCWVHGDLYARHVLIGPDRRLCGVIDWGDVHLGDPALDLSVAFTLVPPGSQAKFAEAYGDVSPGTWERARFRALHYGAVLLTYGAEVGDECLREAGEYALRAIAEEIDAVA